ncbi:XdhC family protein [Promicromonospora sp. NPDC052451]|uniref:XdhC family protein n=1 Tax=Promicromonospora sp. NPDC052451 TaxID=3364407 RepID=UPI0037C8690C
MLDLLPQLLDWWRTGERAAVATVVRTFRSAPREPGAAMAVGPGGEVIGSVSGGCVEGAVYDVCLEVAETGRPALVRYGVSDEAAFDVGLTCGGTIELFVAPLSRAAWPDFDAFARRAIGRTTPGSDAATSTHADAAAGGGVCLATVVAAPGGTTVGRHLIVLEAAPAEPGASAGPGPRFPPGPAPAPSLGDARLGDAGLGNTELDAAGLDDAGRGNAGRGNAGRSNAGLGNTELDPAELGNTELDAAELGNTGLGNAGLDAAVAADAVGQITAGLSTLREYGPHGERTGTGTQVFLQVFAPRPRLLVFGAIDFAAAMTRAGRLLGYHVTVCDARPIFTTAQRFPEADELVVDWPHRYLTAEIEAGRVSGRDAVCVLTHDPKFDVPLLRTALTGLPAGTYVGAMGSRRAHADREARLIDDGVPPEALARLRSPIGLDLGARTPDETAVAIAAEMIATRSGASARPLRETHGPIHG